MTLNEQIGDSPFIRCDWFGAIDHPVSRPLTVYGSDNKQSKINNRNSNWRIYLLWGLTFKPFVVREYYYGDTRVGTWIHRIVSAAENIDRISLLPVCTACAKKILCCIAASAFATNNYLTISSLPRPCFVRFIQFFRFRKLENWKLEYN